MVKKTLKLAILNLTRQSMLRGHGEETMSSRMITSAGGMSALKRFTKVNRWDMDTPHCSDALTDEM